MTDPKLPPEPLGLDERVQEETVVHRGWVAAAFAIVAWGLIALACWLTGTKRGWAALIFAIACGVALYLLMHPPH